MSDVELGDAAFADPLEGRLARFFTAELALAEEDLRVRPIRARAPGRPAVPLAGLLTATGLAVVAGVVLWSIGAGPRGFPGTPAPGSPVPGSAEPIPPPATASPSPGMLDRYPDGIPRFITGEPVFRPADALRRLDESVAGRTALVGGWQSNVALACVLIPTGQSPPPGCRLSALAETPGSEPVLLAVPADGVAHPGEGPVVLRIHALTRSETDCQALDAAACRRFQLDAVVWAGDEQTRTGPLTISQVVRQLRAIDASFSVTPIATGGPCWIGWPPQTWDVLGDLRVSRLAVFATIAARQQAERQLRSPSLPDCSLIGPHLPAGWAVFENVMVRIEGDDQAFERTLVHALSGGAQYDDGIPRWIDGEPVFRPSEAPGLAREIEDDTPFLLGGWLERFYPPCPPPPSGRTDSPLLPFCNGVMIVDVPGSATGAPLVFLRGVVPPPQGPVVLRVHVHDPLARECGSSIRDACERAIVVEAVAWTGDP